ncbi:uncharacterized protein K452DRAFT_289932 [Aplosporella prunicola CBS 121167]|uniref:N-terminal nucleophile aminohydrolase n=1 Tax=Aplosporella prunicola CBS 121167 TaxID=1176127 RepID=A0A6A6B5G7_9PEZI|nr:uncharacterized protein K452DRAFT_289932 [Aplosporella prunicola CBS 121167]KAF2139382.1 hypothetical protein K452DRAFT_289932 [Aplosporella prunicola CBS 121167]
MSSTAKPKSEHITPRIIIHGGAGNITRHTLSSIDYQDYRTALHDILIKSYTRLLAPRATALDVATHAVTLFENNALFNAAHGAVFTRAGTNELEASVMVSRGHHKRGAGCMLIKHVKNPILLAKELLLRGDAVDDGGAGAHCQLAGAEVEKLARAWGLDMVEQEYFFTQRRWKEHLRGLEREKAPPTPTNTYDNDDKTTLLTAPASTSTDPTYDPTRYLPQGTVGAVVLDSSGTICAATSTGGLTNKLPGRIGDTPTLGAGFWAEEWTEPLPPRMLYQPQQQQQQQQQQPPPTPLDKLSRGDLASMLTDCIPTLTPPQSTPPAPKPQPRHHALGISGTGNGDSFLRTSAARTAAAQSRFATPNLPLSAAIESMAGPGGELQRSAGDRWNDPSSGEGQGGMIGIELVDGVGEVCWDLNCGGMFRAWVDEEGRARVAVYADEEGD